jgi:sarcosine oxidase subunit alpha
MSDDRRVNRHPVLGPLPEVETVTFRFEGEILAGRVAEPVAAALLAQGIRTLRYSEPSGRPRGLYCAIGHCMECRMIIDGLANVRACLTPLRQGMQVRRQSLDVLASDR